MQGSSDIRCIGSRRTDTRIAGVVAAVLMLAGCSATRDDAPGAVTADEAAQLNDAAAMLDVNSIDLNAVAPDTNESTPP